MDTDDTDYEYNFGQKFNFVKLNDYKINKKPVFIKVKITSHDHGKKHPLYPNTKAFKRIAKSKISTPSGITKAFYLMTTSEAEAKKKPKRAPKKKVVQRRPTGETNRSSNRSSNGMTRRIHRKAKTEANKRISGGMRFGCARPGSCSFGQHPTPLSSFWGPFTPSTKDTTATAAPDTKKSAFGAPYYTTEGVAARYSNKFGLPMKHRTSSFSAAYDGTSSISKTAVKVNNTLDSLNKAKFGARTSRFGSGKVKSKFGTRTSHFGSGKTKSKFGTRTSRFGCGSQNRFGIPYGAMQFGREAPRY